MQEGNLTDGGDQGRQAVWLVNRCASQSSHTARRAKSKVMVQVAKSGRRGSGQLGFQGTSSFGRLGVELQRRSRVEASCSCCCSTSVLRCNAIHLALHLGISCVFHRFPIIR